jgi:hypothetical protein
MWATLSWGQPELPIAPGFLQLTFHGYNHCVPRTQVNIYVCGFHYGMQPLFEHSNSSPLWGAVNL